MEITKAQIKAARNVLQFRYDKMREILKAMTFENKEELLESPEIAEYYAAKRMYEVFVPEMVEHRDGKLIYREIKEI